MGNVDGWDGLRPRHTGRGLEALARTRPIPGIKIHDNWISIRHLQDVHNQCAAGAGGGGAGGGGAA